MHVGRGIKVILTISANSLRCSAQMRQQPKPSVKRQRTPDAKATASSDVDLLDAIRRELIDLYAELLDERPPDHIANLVRRLEEELKRRS
jgi:hypothetical protein